MKNVVYLKILVVAIAAAAVFSLVSLDKTPVPAGNDLKVFASQDQLSEFLDVQQSYSGSSLGSATRQTLEAGDVAAPAAAPQAGAGKSGYSTTNIQVAGVDEADFVKNDGKYIYTISGSDVVITDAYPAEAMKILSTINLSGTSPSQLYINGDRLVVFGNNYNYYGGPMPMEVKSAAPSDVKSAGPGTVAAGIMPIRYGGSTTYIKIYDVADHANPVLKRDLEFNGSYYDSRMIGDYVYGILSVPANGPVPVFSPYQRGFPQIYYFDIPSYYYQYTNIVSLNVNDDTAETKNKVFMLGYSTNMYVSENNIFLVYQKQLGPYYTMEKMLEVALPLLPSDVANEITSIKASGKSDYRKYGEIELVLSEWMQNNPEAAATMQRQIQSRMEQVYRDIQVEQDKSVIHKISINNGEINYVGHNEVPGTPLNQFSMDESNGYFRIATTTTNVQAIPRLMDTGGGSVGVTSSGSASSGTVLAGSGETAGAAGTVLAGSGIEGGPADTGVVASAEPGQTAPSKPITQPSEPTANPLPPEPAEGPTTQNNLYVLDSSMNVVGRLENLAPGERIYSARFIGNRAYLVTFKQVDPLFVIDLSEPTLPKVLGELVIPGWSDYLHPYDETHLIGIGKDVDPTIDQDKVHTTDAVYYTAVKGLKVSLFDVSDVAKPKELAKYIIGDRGTYSEATNDHKAFLFSKDKNLLVIPVSLYENKQTNDQWGTFTWQGAYALNVDLSGITLKGQVTHSNGTDPWSNAVRRSLYIDNTLYTVSGGMIKANSLDNFTEISSVDLPNYYGPIIYY